MGQAERRWTVMDFLIALVMAVAAFIVGVLIGLDTAAYRHCDGPFRIDQGRRIVCQQLIDTKGGGQ